MPFHKCLILKIIMVLNVLNSILGLRIVFRVNWTLIIILTFTNSLMAKDYRT